MLLLKWIKPIHRGFGYRNIISTRRDTRGTRQMNMYFELFLFILFLLLWFCGSFDSIIILSSSAIANKRFNKLRPFIVWVCGAQCIGEFLIQFSITGCDLRCWTNVLDIGEHASRTLTAFNEKIDFAPIWITKLLARMLIEPTIIKFFDTH